MVILHGLTGGSETLYVQELVASSVKCGYRTVVVNRRGVNQHLTTPFTYHGGSLDDMKHAISHIKEKYPEAPLVAVGLSLGGN
mmetsp:Transcript_33414/g.30409  ORF Transcript_33414/g.30409 Transcript_33414/m.30409 type:complete len:83 (+) Transcript_33414:457-705(+)